MKPEAKVKAQIQKRMKSEYPDAWGFMPVAGPYGKAGVPDHIYCVPVKITQDMVGRTMGAFVSIEAKAISGRLSPTQIQQLTAIAAASGVAMTVQGIEAAKTFQIDLKYDPSNPLA